MAGVSRPFEPTMEFGEGRVGRWLLDIVVPIPSCKRWCHVDAGLCELTDRVRLNFGRLVSWRLGV